MSERGSMEEGGKSAGRFAGRVAIVTGASREPSIGRATATRLLREGAAVVINGRDEAALRDAESALRGPGGNVLAIAGSAETEETARRLVAGATREFGRLDMIVNTVGGNHFLGTPAEMTREDLIGTIELNTWGTVALIQAAREGGLGSGGAIVNISSGTVYKTTPKMIAYAAAKSALNAITKTLARDLGPAGIRVNSVAPGLTRTDGTRGMWEPDGGEAAARNLLLGRLTEAEDIANACVFLLSDEARQITGHIIDVDGGNHLMGGGWTPMTDEEIQGRMK
jgi:NAD(P)-dependent dehydrogenase (short-subunit alcohol dehydrogenase family)